MVRSARIGAAVATEIAGVIRDRGLHIVVARTAVRAPIARIVTGAVIRVGLSPVIASCGFGAALEDATAIIDVGVGIEIVSPRVSTPVLFAAHIQVGVGVVVVGVGIGTS